MTGARIIDAPALRDREAVFRDRHHAGEVLAGLLSDIELVDAIVLGIPAGGVPVAVALAGRLNLPLDVAVVSKMTLPGNSEVGYGAVAFDGTLRLNEALIAHYRLRPGEVARGIADATAKVARRAASLRGDRTPPRVSGRACILVDDGLASGYTMCVAIEAMTKAGATPIVVAVPTGNDAVVAALAREVRVLCCANRRGGLGFAVADAYESWRDIDEGEARGMLAAVWERVPAAGAGDRG